MLLKRKLWLFYINFFQQRFLNKTLQDTCHFNINTDPLPANNQNIDIITVAFNNEVLIQKQIELIRKNVKDTHYTYIVADNSSDAEKRKQIKEICQANQVAYISLPENNICSYVGPSYSHGASLNWLYYNIIKHRRPAYFGFIDHDLFPVSNYTIGEKIANQDLFGVLYDLKESWYLWAGFCFFRFKATENVKLNFFPYMIYNPYKIYLDTGGSNWPVLYSRYAKDTLRLLPEGDPRKISASTDDSSKLWHRDYINIIDRQWIHIVNGSDWKKIGNKNDKLEEILNSYS